MAVAISLITNKVTTYLADNIRARSAKLREILNDILGNLGGKSAIVSTYINVVRPYSIPTIYHDSYIGDTQVSTGDIVSFSAQDVPAENGIYVIGASAGETARHPDFADAASMANKILLASNPDENGNTLLTTSVDNGGTLKVASVVTAAKEQTVVKQELSNAGDNEVLFPDGFAYPDANWEFIAMPYCYNAEGQVIMPTITNKTATGFTVNLGETGYINFKTSY